jgi:cysteine synthase
MDWRNIPPCYQRLPEPLFEIPVDDFSLPVIVLPEELLSDGLRGERIRIYLLLGFMAPPGNIKRIPAGYMVQKALECGRIAPGGTLIEPTSGNFGLSLAYCAHKHNINVIALVSDKLPRGKRLPLERHGAEVITESELAHKLGVSRSYTSIELAEMYAKTSDAVFLNQYNNPWNPESYHGVAQQVWNGVGGQISLFVPATGSKGNLIGFGSQFRTWNPKIEIVSTRPYFRQNIDGARDKRRQAEVGNDVSLVGEIIDEPIDERTARLVSELLYENGIPAGPSAGAALGSADHMLLSHVENDTLKNLRCADGTIGVFIPFADTCYPYD